MAPLRITGTVVAAAAMVMLSSYCYLGFFFRISDKDKKKKRSTRNGLVDAIGNTPLIRINSLSEATGCEVFLDFLYLV